ncbi:MAG: S-layer homology domain-containing protein [Oscillospiraceae bacterium]|nr:S-layer homology domain-containing protein [Oscillospiraceae bacterium]
MNRQQRRSAGRARKAALAMLVAGALAASAAGDLVAFAAEANLSITGGTGGNGGCDAVGGATAGAAATVLFAGSTFASDPPNYTVVAAPGGARISTTDDYAQGGPGGNATVTASASYSFEADTVTIRGGAGGNGVLGGMTQPGGDGGNAALSVAGKLRSPELHLIGGADSATGAVPGTGGTASLNVTGTLVVGVNYSLNFSSPTDKTSYSVANYEFDLTGAGPGDTLLEVDGKQIAAPGTPNFALSGSGFFLGVGDVVTLIEGVSNTVTCSKTLRIGGSDYNFNITTESNSLIATLESITPVSSSGGGGGGGPQLPPPGPPQTPPDKNPGSKTLTSGDLDDLWANAVNGVMVLIMPDGLDKLELNIPLSWFVENLGATLLVYSEGLGLMAITSENMIELAALSYSGEGGVTIEMHGKEFTFNPDTMITYMLEKGSAILSVAAEGDSLVWYVYDSPLILGIPDGGEGDDWVAYRVLEDGSEKIMPRSLMRGGLVYTLVNEEGEYDVKANPVGFGDVAGHWMEDAARFMAARGIMVGYDGEFAPDRSLTRAEYTTMLIRMMDYSSDEYDAMPFSDVSEGVWYYESALAAASLGITEGRGDGTFGPRDVITRQEMFVMTYEALRQFYLIIPGEDSLDSLDVFSDADEIDPDALEAVAELVANGLVIGSGGALNAKGELSRAEAAQFLTNVIRFIVPDFSELLDQ